MIAKPMIISDKEMMAKALLTEDCSISLWAKCIFCLPVKECQIFKTATAKVLVFIPPPVDAGDAPTHINIMVKKMTGVLNPAISTVLKPAVRGDTDPKKETTNFPKMEVCSCKVGRFHSATRKNIHPIEIRIIVVYKTIFEFRLNLTL